MICNGIQLCAGRAKGVSNFFRLNCYARGNSAVIESYHDSSA